MARAITYHYRRPGKNEQRFIQRVALDGPDAKVLLTDAYGGDRLTVNGEPILEPGAPIVWYVFPERWHDIGRFHLADETLTGWYTNLVTPVEIKGDAWSATDMFIDLWQPADGGPAVWMDEDEFTQAARQKVIDATTRQRVLNERTMIDLQVKAGAWPPPIAKDIDLAQARQLAG